MSAGVPHDTRTLEELLAAGEVEYAILLPDGATKHEAEQIQKVCKVAYEAGKAHGAAELARVSRERAAGLDRRRRRPMTDHAQDFHERISGKVPHRATLHIWAPRRLTREELEFAGDVLQAAMAGIEERLFDEGVDDVTVEMVGPSGGISSRYPDGHA